MCILIKIFFYFNPHVIDKNAALNFSVIYRFYHILIAFPEKSPMLNLRFLISYNNNFNDEISIDNNSMQNINCKYLLQNIH